MWKTTLKYKNLLSLTSNILGSYMQVFTSVRGAYPCYILGSDMIHRNWFIYWVIMMNLTFKIILKIIGYSYEILLCEV